MQSVQRDGSARPSQAIQQFLAAFVIFFVIILVDVHFLAFFPLTIRDPLSIRMSIIVASLGGLCAGTYVVSRRTH